MGLPYNIAEITADLQPAQLDGLCCQLSNEISRLCKLVAGYEIAFKSSEKALKRSIGEATIKRMGQATPSVLKLIVETDVEVIAASDKLEADEAILILGKAELDGRTSQYQAVKKLIDLKCSEIRNFRV